MFGIWKIYNANHNNKTSGCGDFNDNNYLHNHKNNGK